MRVRWCCADFKEGAGAGRVTLTGVRRKESARRAKRNEMEVSARQKPKFSGNPEQFEQWQSEQIEKIKRRMLKQEGKHLGEDYFSLDKDREIRCIGGKDTIIVNPMLDWSEQDVWYFLDSVVCVPHCKLYDRGYHRIGCILCPMSSYKQKVREMKDYPHVKRGWLKAIKEIRRGGYKAPIHYSAVWNYESGRVYPSRTELLDAGNSDTATPRKVGTTDGGGQMVSQTAHGNVGGFSSSPSADGTAEGQSPKPTEDEIAERIFDWWISGKSYDRWYAETYLQIKLDFNTE